MYLLILNVIAIIFLFVSTILPVVILGTDMAADFWRTAWPMELVMVAAIGGMNAFFLTNRRLFDLLRKEDWPALAEYLEKKIYKDGKFSSRNVRLLLHAYIVSGEIKSAAVLEEKVAAGKPALLEKFALLFGVARMIGGNVSSAAEFFKERLERGNKGGHRPQSGHWLRWYYGFALTLAGSYDQAQAVFGETASGAKDGIVTGLSAFFLSEILGKAAGFAAAADTGYRDRAEEAAGRVRGELKTLDIWKAKAAKVETEVYGAIIRKNIAEAGEWIFSEQMREK